MVVIIVTTTVITTLPTTIITTLPTILIILVVLEAEGPKVVAEEEDPRVGAAEEDPKVVAGAEGPKVVAGVEDVEDLDRIRGDPLGGEFGPRVPMKQGLTAGSEMTLPF
jgi:hypothetical protein